MRRWELNTHIYEREYVDNTCFLNHGAFFGIGTKNTVIQSWWGANKIIADEDDNDEYTVPICCIMGASYSTSKKWWNYIHGYNGLRGYGDEEFFISMKTWQAGGTVRTFKQIGIGHMAKFYYQKCNNPDYPHYIDYFIAKICGEDEFFNWFVNYNKKYKLHYTEKWLNYLNCEDVDNEVKYQRSIRKNNLKWVLQEINGRALNNDRSNEYCGKCDTLPDIPYPFFLKDDYYKLNKLIIN